MAEDLKLDGIMALRTGFGDGAPEFGTSLGGYNKAEVALYIEGQREAVEKMRRVFYEKTDELRDEISVLAEENRSLKEALMQLGDEAPQYPMPKGGTRAEADREQLLQIAHRIKRIYVAELKRHEDESAALNAALDGQEAALSKAHEALAREKTRAEQQRLDHDKRLLALEAHNASLLDELNRFSAVGTEAARLNAALDAQEAALAEAHEALAREKAHAEQQRLDHDKRLLALEAHNASLLDELNRLSAVGTEAERLRLENQRLCRETDEQHEELLKLEAMRTESERLRSENRCLSGEIVAQKEQLEALTNHARSLKQQQAEYLTGLRDSFGILSNMINATGAGMPGVPAAGVPDEPAKQEGERHEARPDNVIKPKFGGNIS